MLCFFFIYLGQGIIFMVKAAIRSCQITVYLELRKSDKLYLSTPLEKMYLMTSDGHTFVYSLHRYRYRYIVSNDRYKRTPSVICL
jgi:hypothetical protein